MHHKKYFGLLGMTAAAVLCAQSAFATVTWDFTDKDGGTNNQLAGEKFFTSTSVLGGTYQIKVEAWSMDPNVANPTFVKAKKFKDFGSGFGMKSHANEATGQPEHAIDNKNWFEFVLFDFQADWRVLSATAGWAQEGNSNKGGNNSPEADLFYWNESSNPYTHDVGETLLGWTYVAQGSFDEGTSETPHDYSSNTSGVTARYWLLAPNTCGAADGPSCSSDGDLEAFKLTKLTGEVAPPGEDVPEPATALLLLAALPFMRRRGIAIRKS